MISATSSAASRTDMPVNEAGTLPRAPIGVHANEILVKLESNPIFRGVRLMPRGPARKQAVFDELVRIAIKSQAPVLEVAQRLKDEGKVIAYERLVSPDVVVVYPTVEAMSEVTRAMRLPGVEEIYNSEGYLIPVGSEKNLRPAVSQSPQQVQASARAATKKAVDTLSVIPTSVRKTSEDLPYNLKMIGAEEAWKQGATGKGFVYGSVDTGVDVTHPALHDSYRGTQPDGTLANEYNWMDFESLTPRDKPTDWWSNGTLTTGAVVGKTADGPIGGAPNAQWIAVHGLTGFTPDVLKGMQWMLAPTNQAGGTPDPSKGADVVGISWTWGKAWQNLMKESIENLTVAGIEVVKSAGNKGLEPETISSPGQFEDVHTIGAVDEQGSIAEYSSRGPSPLPHRGKGRFKPDVAAPGVNIYAPLPDNGWAIASGTAMAQPQASAAILDIMSKYPNMPHSSIMGALRLGSIDAGAKGPDVEFGYGILNIPAALKLLKAKPESVLRNYRIPG